MNYRFENYVKSASANKRAFDSSIEGVRRSLHNSLNTATAPAIVPTPAKTGWLKGGDGSWYWAQAFGIY